MQFANSVKRLVFDLTKIPFLKCLIGICPLIVEVLNNQNLFTESNLADWFLSYVKFCSCGHFSERAEAARQCGKVNHLGTVISFEYKDKLWFDESMLVIFCMENT